MEIATIVMTEAPSRNFMTLLNLRTKSTTTAAMTRSQIRFIAISLML